MSTYVGDATSTALISTGANVIVPGSGPIVAVGISVLNSLFGGNQDAQRQARVDWFAQAARQGSLIAARVMFGALTNTASNERKQWQAAIDKLRASTATAGLMQRATAAGGFWIPGDDASSSKMRAAVEDELQAFGTSAPPPSGGGSLPNSTFPVPPADSSGGTLLPGTVTLPLVTTRAPYNFGPIFLAAGIALVGIVAYNAVNRRRGR